MADSNIDEINRKPRRTRGTPSFHYRNRFAIAFIVAGSSLFGLIACLPSFKKFNKELGDKLSVVTEEEIGRKALFSFLPPKRGEEILRLMEQEKDFRKER